MSNDLIISSMNTALTVTETRVQLDVEEHPRPVTCGAKRHQQLPQVPQPVYVGNIGRYRYYPNPLD
jgi:hypothetical protein